MKEERETHKEIERETERNLGSVCQNEKNGNRKKVRILEMERNSFGTNIERKKDRKKERKKERKKGRIKKETKT